MRALGAASPRPSRVLDLGCGTGAAGAAWALEAGGCAVAGLDRSGWAVDEARWTLRALGLSGSVRKGDVLAAEAQPGDAVIAAFTVNELPAEARERLRDKLLAAAGAGSSRARGGAPGSPRAGLVAGLGRRRSPGAAAARTSGASAKSGRRWSRSSTARRGSIIAS